MKITFKDGFKFGIGFIIAKGTCDVIGTMLVSILENMTKYFSEDEIRQINQISKFYGGYQLEIPKKSVEPKVMNKIGF